MPIYDWQQVYLRHHIVTFPPNCTFTSRLKFLTYTKSQSENTHGDVILLRRYGGDMPNWGVS